ncbi:response regulator transcription factor [Amycolatopsis sp. FDAARGOS 1241]|uniref:LuxR C-terminal-related transcriptional regulator n=1 Tax=Amycolatopsis sp. FDAARGOS 1241 TaxID=2778070 RepID=UPI0019524C99|nr:response regulator transcription factor [Amycolatopsis sp. FDAARGOS 1241]QRP44810.1 response regulator transcription factor [Amycolatopsis sp. FDAARGOS 1241]
MDITRLFLIEDHLMVADVLTSSLATVPWLRVVGTRSATDPALRPALSAQQPDVVTVELQSLTDVRERIRTWREAAPAACFVALTASRDRELAVSAAHAGINTWIPKESSLEDLLDRVRGARAGHAWYPPELLAALFDRLRRDGAAPRRTGSSPLDVLSGRELEVLVAMVDGDRSDQIAARLQLSRHTVRTHTRNLFRKLKVHSGLEVVKIARAAGIEPTGQTPARKGELP